MWVVARTRRQFDADTVGLLFHASRIRTHERQITGRAQYALAKVGIDTIIGADERPTNGCSHTKSRRLTGLFAAMLAHMTATSLNITRMLEAVGN